MKYLLAIAVMALSSLAYGEDRIECKDGVCRIVKSQELVSEAPKFQWIPSSADQVLLLKDGRTVGQWYVPDNCYYPWDGSKIGSACKPPIDPPKDGQVVAQVLDWQKKGVAVRPDREQISRGGKVYPTHKLHEVFAGAELDDDSGKGHFIIVAKSPEQRQKVFEDWQKLPDDFRVRYNVWMTPPEHFSMIDRFSNKPRFYTEGDPSVILQGQDGTVLFRRPQAQQVYKTADMQDLLKSDPNYNPKLDPGAPEAPAVVLTTQSKIALAVAGAGLLLVLRRKQS